MPQGRSAGGKPGGNVSYRHCFHISAMQMIGGRSLIKFPVTSSELFCVPFVVILWISREESFELGDNQ